MDKEIQDKTREVILRHGQRAVTELIYLHAALMTVNEGEAIGWVKHMISALNTMLEFYSQDSWE